MRVRCPTCGRWVPYTGTTGESSFPFCSERCKLIDLGKWLDEEHRIESPLEDESPEADTTEPENGRN